MATHRTSIICTGDRCTSVLKVPAVTAPGRPHGKVARDRPPHAGYRPRSTNETHGHWPKGRFEFRPRSETGANPGWPEGGMRRFRQTKVICCIITGCHIDAAGTYHIRWYGKPPHGLPC